ncbi:MAG: rod shape-determining protein MreC [Sphingobacteriales bacterium]|nr:rod shape-determining protein MreC [Sphingobacteriales bacterium]MBP9141856.1 rod shape-determining protein MreC [Chitinophagales bacterium]MDA0199860.1 rod shape-determining protein MreC [Bacteroidota bacterium]MBK6889482.1 rod shape-determining protein MreC [Sphingobacteriales bacterium]MBK7528014.1 rod shape-determining protein MreC [Sphingobacteriales bacterium]
MRNLLLFFTRYNAFLVFLLLQILSFGLLLRYNHYQRATTFSNLNIVTGTMIEKTDKIRDYVKLQDINTQLAEENALLLQEISTLRQQLDLNTGSECIDIYPTLFANNYNAPLALDTAGMGYDSLAIDSLKKQAALELEAKISRDARLYNFLGAKIINGSLYRTNNYLTINKGSLHGVRQEMGVVSKNGIVGVVSAVSPNFATVIPILNRNLQISCKVKRNNVKGSLTWNDPMPNPKYAYLEGIGKDILIMAGDTVLTSGYSEFFPASLPVGVIDDIQLAEGSNLYRLRVRLDTDFQTLEYVYLIDNIRKNEQRTLEDRNK